MLNKNLLLSSPHQKSIVTVTLYKRDDYGEESHAIAVCHYGGKEYNLEIGFGYSPHTIELSYTVDYIRIDTIQGRIDSYTKPSHVIVAMNSSRTAIEFRLVKPNDKITITLYE